MSENRRTYLTFSIRFVLLGSLRGPFGGPLGSLWEAFGVLGGSSGIPGRGLGEPRWAIGTHWGVFGKPLGGPWGPWEILWDSSGGLGESLGGPNLDNGCVPLRGTWAWPHSKGTIYRICIKICTRSVYRICNKTCINFRYDPHGIKPSHHCSCK